MIRTRVKLKSAPFGGIITSKEMTAVLKIFFVVSCDLLSLAKHVGFDPLRTTHFGIYHFR
jgi:hypothetical protein